MTTTDDMVPTTPTTAMLLDRARARWAEIGAARPELTPAIAMQESMVARTIRTVARLGDEQPALLLEPTAVANKLRAGAPVMRGEPVVIPVALLGPLVLEACDDLAGGGAGEVARRVRSCLSDGRVDVGSLLAASFDRNQNAIRAKAMHEGIAPDVLWLAAELAVGPLAFVTSNTLLGRGGTGLPRQVADELAAWPHGWCPACGSWPAFGEARDGAGHLRCSFCGLGWHPTAPGCTYCGEDPTRLTSVKTDPGASHRAELCSECGAYLKWLDLVTPTPFELLPVEDLASADVDALAAEQGFGRPPLPQLGGPDRLPCEGMPGESSAR